MASAVLTVEDVREEYVVASSNPLDAEYLFTLRSQFCPNLTGCYCTWMVNKLRSAIEKKKIFSFVYYTWKNLLEEMLQALCVTDGDAQRKDLPEAMSTL